MGRRYKVNIVTPDFLQFQHYTGKFFYRDPLTMQSTAVVKILAVTASARAIAKKNSSRTFGAAYGRFFEPV
jgi:hypothetical protein